MLLWIMIGAQLVAWGWFSLQGGKVSDKQFLIFTIGMLIGQLGSGIETYLVGATRTLIVQIYFFVFTAFGGIQRYKQIKSLSKNGPC